MSPRLFQIIKDAKIAAHGIVFDNNKCCVCSEGDFSVLVIIDSFEDMRAIYSDENTHIIFYQHGF